jgi:nucleoid-associated protein YgaU
MAKKNINIAPPKSYTSLVYGIIAVVVIFVVLFFGVRAIQQRQADVTPSAEETTSEKAKTYVVKESDSLWSIAENEYKDGHKWTEIAKANKLENPDAIEKGMKLILPEIMVSPTPAIAEQAESETKRQEVPAGGKITGNSYKIVQGDNLWEISVRAYGDGYRWPELARVNNIPNPDLIYPGDTLKLPR